MSRRKLLLVSKRKKGWQNEQYCRTARRRKSNRKKASRIKLKADKQEKEEQVK